MRIERRKGGLYVYSSPRVNGRPRTVYSGKAAELTIAFFSALQEQRRCEKAAEDFRRFSARVAAEQADAVLDAIAPFSAAVENLFRAAMHAAGYRLHQRGEWRMATQDPVPAIYVCRSVDADEQQLIERAASGDAASLPAVRKLLDSGHVGAKFGDLHAIAVASVIRSASGTDLFVKEAITREHQRQLDELLAECGSPLEQLAAKRVALNWLTVHALTIMVGNEASQRAAMLIDRRLADAERRLHAAMKSLTLLRRLRKPNVKVGQVNVANGPMMVNSPPPVPKRITGKMHKPISPTH